MHSEAQPAQFDETQSRSCSTISFLTNVRVLKVRHLRESENELRFNSRKLPANEREKQSTSKPSCFPTVNPQFSRNNPDIKYICTYTGPPSYNPARINSSSQSAFRHYFDAQGTRSRGCVMITTSLAFLQR
jgi:hypothetical protein